VVALALALILLLVRVPPPRRPQVNDFCMYGPPENNNSPMGDIEGEVVAYCTQPRNGARLIPDGALRSAHVSPSLLRWRGSSLFPHDGPRMS